MNHRRHWRTVLALGAAIMLSGTASAARAAADPPDHSDGGDGGGMDVDYPGNVALNKAIKASRDVCGGSTKARFANDGDRTTYACMSGPNDWQDASRLWRINLGAVYPIRTVRIWHVGDLQEFRPVFNTYAYNLDVSTDGSHWTTVAVCEDNEASVTTHQFAVPVDARYLRVAVWEPDSLFNAANRNANIAEIEAYT